MSIFDTILSTAGATAVLVALVLWLARKIIETRLRASVEHEFNIKIEGVRTASERNLAELRHALDTRKDAIAALRTDVFAAATGRRNAIDIRRLAAIDHIWTIATEDLTRLKPAANTMAVVKFEETLRLAQTNKALRDIFATITPKVDPKEDPLTKAAKERPYLSETAWGLFAAWNAIVTFALLQLKLIAEGLDKPEILNGERVEAVIMAALPHQEAYLKKYGPSAHAYLIDEIELKLIAELRRMLSGNDEEEAALERAQGIVEATDRFFEHKLDDDSAAAALTAGAVRADVAPRPGGNGEFNSEVPQPMHEEAQAR